MSKAEPNSALLVMDVQIGIVTRFPDYELYLDKLSKTITQARSAKIPIIYLVVRLRPNHPEAAPWNKSFIRNPTCAGYHFDDPHSEIHPAVAPKLDEGDIVVTKFRTSAFTGSDLEVILRSQRIEKPVLTGFATSGVVLSTVREASDRDYQCTVLEDLCMDVDEEVQRVLMKKIFPKQADVVASKDWLSDLLGKRA